MINQFKKAAYQQGYLLIAALWLYTISFIFINYWSYHASPNKVKTILEDRLEQKNSQYQSLIADTALLNHLIADSLPVRNPVDNEVGIFIYATNQEEQGPVYWNNNQLYIQTQDLQRKPGTYFITNRNGNFEFIKSVLPIRGKSYTIYGMVPVIWSFFIENKYLQTRFAGFEGLEEQYEISRDTLATPILVNGTQELFRIKLKSGKSFIEYDTVTILLRVLAILLLGLFLHAVALEVIAYSGFYKGFLLLFTSVILLRFLMYFCLSLLISPSYHFLTLPFMHPMLYIRHWVIYWSTPCCFFGWFDFIKNTTHQKRSYLNGCLRK